MSQMPDIKPEVNVTKEREEKKGGGLLGLLSRLSGGGASGGATGGIGGLGGAAAGGGLLATKAGLIGLVLAGTTVAGGIGVVGWTAFGPGQGDRADNPALQLFASKPKEAASPFGGVAPVAKDGSSQSLSFLAQANAPKGEAGTGEAAPADQTAAAAADAAAPAENATPHMGEGVATNGAAPKTGLQNVKKLGALSQSFGSGGSGGASASAAKVNPAGATASNAAGGKGALGGSMARGTASNARSIGRGVARARGGTATRQAMNALGENRRAFSSQAGGRTYDGSAGSNGTAGVDAGLPSGGPGVGSDAGAQPTSTPNQALSKSEFEAPPTPTGKNVTPWQNAVNMAAALMLLGSLLVLAIGNASKMGITQGLALTLAILASVVGAAVIAIGGRVATGDFKQPMQGALLAVAGAALVTAAWLAYSSMGSDQKSNEAATKSTTKTTTTTSESIGANGEKTTTTVTSTENSGPGAGANPVSADSGFMGLSGWTLLFGGAAAVATVGAMLAPKKSIDSSEFENGRAPDIRLGSMPSQGNIFGIEDIA